MNAYTLPDGAIAHKVVRGARNGDRIEMHTLSGEVVTVRSSRGAEGRYVRFGDAGFLYPLDGTWNASKADAINVIAGELQSEGLQLLEQARELQAQASEA